MQRQQPKSSVEPTEASAILRATCKNKAGALIKRPAVTKLFQNPIPLTCFEICLERKQIPRIVEKT